MKKILLLAIFILLILLGATTTTYARSGCCSWHGGVCGCMCCDGTALSTTCAPYYPSCNSYSYTAPTTPTCPSNSYYSYLSETCICNSGYIVSGNSCVYANSYCENLYGYNSGYDSLTKKCDCDYGSRWNDSGTKCVRNDTYCTDKYGYNSEYDLLSKSCDCDSDSRWNDSGTECITYSEYCTEKYGYGSQANYLTNVCECKTNYEFDGTRCAYKTNTYTNSYSYTAKEIECPEHASPIGSSCYCDSGYTINESKDGCILKEITIERASTANSENQTGGTPQITQTNDDSSYPGYILSFNPNDYDNNVNLLQGRLNIIGYDLTINGYFGEATENAIKNFQSKHGLSQTGKVDQKTWDTLFGANQATQGEDNATECDVGFAPSLNRTSCIPIPEHSHAVTSETDVWLCDDGYEESGNACVTSTVSINTTTHDIALQEPMVDTSSPDDDMIPVNNDRQTKHGFIDKIKKLMNAINFWKIF